MLHMLLKIRGLPPKAPGSSLNGGIMPTADMTLQEHSKSISIPSKFPLVLLSSLALL